MKIGFIGTGNMGSAIVEGYIKKYSDEKTNVFVFDKDTQRSKKLVDTYDIQYCDSIEEIMANSEAVILAVKPNIYGYVLEDIEKYASDQHIVVSIAAGISIAFMESFFKGPIKIVRTMPNTPALVSEGMTALSRNAHILDHEFQRVVDIFKAVGKTEIIDEKLMDVVPGISGSSPAYVYMLIEALADGAVLHGMPRNQAYQMGAQAVLGAAKMVLETLKHPGDLKDMVCSPGGSTIEAVAKLEEKGMRSAVIEAVNVCTEKCKRMNE